MGDDASDYLATDPAADLTWDGWPEVDVNASCLRLLNKVRLDLKKDGPCPVHRRQGSRQECRMAHDRREEVGHGRPAHCQ
jgi:hypothetical protein